MAERASTPDMKTWMVRVSRQLASLDRRPGYVGPPQVRGTAPPTQGQWERASIVWNAAPTAGGTVGWVCVTAGTPGAWRPFGAIGA